MLALFSNVLVAFVKLSAVDGTHYPVLHCSAPGCIDEGFQLQKSAKPPLKCAPVQSRGLLYVLMRVSVTEVANALSAWPCLLILCAWSNNIIASEGSPSYSACTLLVEGASHLADPIPVPGFDDPYFRSLYVNCKGGLVEMDVPPVLSPFTRNFTGKMSGRRCAEC